MDGITTAEGWSISKVEIETNGTRTEIPAPYKYTPVAAGTIRIIITITDGTDTAEFISNSLSIKPLTYSQIAPSKADIYPSFSNLGVQMYKERGLYELMALAKECMQMKNGTIKIIYRE